MMMELERNEEKVAETENETEDTIEIEALPHADAAEFPGNEIVSDEEDADFDESEAWLTEDETDDEDPSFPEDPADEADDLEDAEPDDEEEAGLMSDVIPDDDLSADNAGTLMSVVVDYAFQRGKLKKNIRKSQKKAVRKYRLDVSAHDAVYTWMMKNRKALASDVLTRSGDQADQALRIAYYSGYYLASRKKAGKNSFQPDSSALLDLILQSPGLDKLPAAVHKLSGEKKKRFNRPLTEYTAQLKVYEHWDNVDDGLKKRALRGAIMLGCRKAIRG